MYAPPSVSCCFHLAGKSAFHSTPGVDIVSTLPGGVYGLDTGTSMSAPFVTGVAAPLKVANPSWDWRAIKNQILAGGDAVPALANTVTGRRLNAYGALTCSNSVVGSRLLPNVATTSSAVGATRTLAYLNINCGQPNGPVSVQTSSGGTVNLVDDGTGADQAGGDGTFTPTYTNFDFGQVLVPQLAADLTGDGKADLVELSAVTGSFHVTPATVGPSLQVSLVTTPIVGSSGNAQVSLAVASSSGTTVQLAASDPAISIPASAKIPAGSVS